MDEAVDGAAAGEGDGVDAAGVEVGFEFFDGVGPVGQGAIGENAVDFGAAFLQGVLERVAGEVTAGKENFGSVQRCDFG